jgi:hypothetical protein
LITTSEYGLATPIEPRVAPHVREAIERLGRTEDVKFSPDNRRLALAGFVANACLVFDVRIRREGHGRRIAIDDFAELRSDWLRDPHGFDFIGNGILVVANRAGAVTMFRLPPRHSGGRALEVQPFKVIDRADNADEALKTPGSLCITRASTWYGEMLVCDTFHNRITRHVFSTVAPGYLDSDAICLENQLDIPDGVVVSPDGAAVAVSNHGQHEILLYDRRRMSRTAEPVGRLNGMDYPHGLRFSPDGQHLYTADAGRPLVYKFRRPPQGWCGSHTPVAIARVLSEEVFLKGRSNPQEGGPKGLDLTRDGALIAVTCEHQPLTIYDEAVLFGQNAR